MDYDTFIEIVDDNGFAHHHYFNSETRKVGRELNINEDYFLRLTIGKIGWNYDTINRVFLIMENKTDEEWAKVFSGVILLEEK